MASTGIPAITKRCLLAFMLTSLGAGCGASEPTTPFKRMFRASVENSENRGFMWVAKTADQPDPEGRYEGGYDLEFHAGLGVCRMRHEGGTHPGKVFAGKCNAGYGKKEVSSTEYDLLVARQDAFWHMPPKPGMDLDKVLIGGREADDKPLRLCVTRHQTGWWLLSNHRGYHPGKYVHGKCHFGFGGEELAGDDFYLIAYGSKPVIGARSGGSPDAAVSRDPESGRTAARRGSVDAGSDPHTSVPEEKNADSGAAAVPPTPADVASLKRVAPARPIRCLIGEVACHCEKVSGCTLEGYCPCSG